jgi:hypothetical protein
VIGRSGNERQAATERFVSEATLKSGLGRVLTELDLLDRSAAIVIAGDHDFVEDTSTGVTIDPDPSRRRLRTLSRDHFSRKGPPS